MNGNNEECKIHDSIFIFDGDVLDLSPLSPPLEGRGAVRSILLKTRMRGWVAQRSLRISSTTLILCSMSGSEASIMCKRRSE